MSRQSSGKSAKKEPILEVPRYRHAPRTKDGAIDWDAVRHAKWDVWRRGRVCRMKCGRCSHEVWDHVGGLCTDCRHECELTIANCDHNTIEAVANATVEAWK